MNPESTPVEKPKELSRTEIGKLRAQYMTKGPFDTVVTCGHIFHPTNEPTKANCPDCWGAFFHVHPGIVAASQSIVSAFGIEQLVKCRGNKFVKHYNLFTDRRAKEIKNGKQENTSSGTETR